MTIELALNLIPQRIAELGYCQRYHTELRQFKLQGGTTLNIDAQNELWFLVEGAESLQLESDNGLMEITNSLISEAVYEHTGRITIKNKNSVTVIVKFLQVIPVKK
jgi:hypothetical protein